MYRLTQINKKIVLFIFLIININVFLKAQKPTSKKFTLVIDAGHGGHDGGAKSHIKDKNGYRILEKDIALAVALKLGKLVKENYKEVNVIYTRKTDVFIELDTRARIANNAKADLFIAIHCNAGQSGAYGSETWILGIEDNRQNTNFDVIKRENSVIYLEDDYEKKYDGFDPSSPEDVIAMTLMQSVYYDSSFKIATYIENEYKKVNRFSRGLKQGGWLVLVRTAMPSVLTEIGFVTNSTDALLLNSEEGQNDIAKSIYQGFINYFTGWNKKHKPIEKKIIKPKEIEKSIDGIVYKIQFLTSINNYKAGSIQLRGLKDVQVIKEGNYYRYYYGDTSLKSEKDRNLNLAKKAGFMDAKVVEFKKNEKLTKGYYAIELFNSSRKYSTTDQIFANIPNVIRNKYKSLFYYTFGKANSIADADNLIEMAKKAGFNECIMIKK